MGQKVSPVGFRVGVIRDWESRWYAEKEYGDLLQEDIKVRKLIEKECNTKEYMVSRVEIERSKNRLNLVIRTARPGMFVGADGAKLDDLKKKVAKIAGEKQVEISVVEVANPDLDATLVANKIAKMLEERQSFRTAQKKTIQQTMRSGAKGIKTKVSGRLGGADIARAEGYSEGVVPLHTLRSDIDYALAEAMTTYGILGVKVWICRGEVLPGEMAKEPEKPKNTRDNGRRFNRRPRRDAAPAEAPKAAPAAAEKKEGE
ncbi:MAG: 30S ribosomal protein S3 [Erysipelotrichaceae bacterium]|nr:30S ribosomal protein S3 [Erysipelotrichaceae bacterium]